LNKSFRIVLTFRHTTVDNPDSQCHITKTNKEIMMRRQISLVLALSVAMGTTVLFPMKLVGG